MLIVSALYQFKKWPDFEKYQEPLLHLCKKNAIKGSLLIAAEGINGTVAGRRESIDILKTYLASELGFINLEYKESMSETYPFYRMKVRLKKEIVTLGVSGIDPTERVGTYVQARDWNDLITDRGVVVIDTRNAYECHIGTFKGAINPNTRSFREFPDFVRKNLDPKKHKRVAMFCTGDIRCEKASAYMLREGFKEVYHLKGGILKYLEEIPKDQSLWEGECFVFDHRVALSHGVQKGDHGLCYACRMPLSQEEQKSPYFEKGVSCPHCHDNISEDQKSRYRHRQKQVDLAASRGQQHMGRNLRHLTKER